LQTEETLRDDRRMNKVLKPASPPEIEDIEFEFLDVDSVDWNAPDIDPEFRADVEAGIADIEAGRMVPIEKVLEWVNSWGTDNELPMPECD
jgi:hypothetical protein